MPMKEVAPETGAVPSAEVQGMPHSRVGQTQRGQAPMPMKEVASETGKVPPAEVQGMTTQPDRSNPERAGTHAQPELAARAFCASRRQ